MPIHVHQITSERYQASLNPNIAYELKPLVHGHNYDGLREDRDYSYEKPHNVFRIIIVGDSLAYGLGVKHHETYAKILERKLNERHNRNKRYEVINLGVPGYSITQIIERIKEKGLKYNPDFIIYGYWLDDIAISCNEHELTLVAAAYDGLRHNKRLILTDDIYQRTIKSILLESQIVRRIIGFYRRMQYQEMLNINLISEDQLEDIITKNVDPEVATLYLDLTSKFSSGLINDLRGFESYYEGYSDYRNFLIWNNKLKEFSEILEKKNIDSLLVMTPVIYNYKDKVYNWKHLHRFIKEVAKCYSIPCLDLQINFSEKSAGQIGQGDYEHPNALGNEIIAEHLFNYLLGTGI
jgi:hypothetical protein